MEYIVERAEVDNVPYGKFQVRVPYIHERGDFEGGLFNRKWVITKEKYWGYLKEDGNIPGYFGGAPKLFDTQEEAEKFLEWWKARQEKIKNEAPL